MKIMDDITSQAFDNFPEISRNIKFPEFTTLGHPPSWFLKHQFFVRRPV